MQTSGEDRKLAAARGDATPGCPLCLERLGSYGGPVTLPCGHNGCLQCMAAVQRRKPECPLCRATFPAGLLLTVNGGLRDLIALASTLHTVEEPDGWQTLAAVKARPAKGEEGYDPDAQPAQDAVPVALVPHEAPLHCDLEAVIAGGGDLLSLEPPTWVPDSHAGDCTACHQPFKPFARSRHHCRLCGNIFCGACSGTRVLLPPKFRSPEPERACSTCAALLEPLQPFLAGTISRAVQPVVRDVTDSSCGHSWLNPPLASGGLEGDIYKAANIATAFRKLGALQAERRIPGAVLRGAAGFAILSMAKVGLGWSCGVGSGLVVSRREEDDSWSPPSAVSAVSAGWGLQVGGELTDLLIVLRSKAAVRAFCGTVAAGLGGGVSFAAGPLGRAADAGLTLGRRGAALAYSYSMSRGAFAGVGVQGTVISAREAANLAFYGRPHSARTLLTSGAVAPPAAAAALYQALDELLSWAELLPQMPGGFLTSRAIQERDAAGAAAHQFQGCAQDGGLLGSGRRGSGRRHGRRGSSWRPGRARGLQDAVGEGGWEADSPSAPQMPLRAGSPVTGAGDGDGWETGADLPGAADIDGDSILAGAGGFGSSILRLPRQSTRPDVSPLPSGRVFGGIASESDDGPGTPSQEAEPDDGTLGCLFAK